MKILRINGVSLTPLIGVGRLSEGTTQMKQAAKLIESAIDSGNLVKVVAGADTKGMTLVKLK